jgi:DNA polymerase III delta subunit
MPRTLVADAGRLGFRLEPEAAVALVERMGANPVRLQRELERLALWAGEGGEVTLEDLAAMVSDTSEAIVWSLADALQNGDPAAALAIAERLVAQGENVTGMIYALSSRLRRSGRSDLHGATEALADLEVWCRGGADYGDELALTLALRRAAGVAA